VEERTNQINKITTARKLVWTLASRPGKCTVHDYTGGLSMRLLFSAEIITLLEVEIDTMAIT
jgi:hypothetical protein